MVLLHQGPLPVDEIHARWYDSQHEHNYGAMASFIGVVREEGGIEALSFDIYEPILQSWFEEWQEKARQRGAVIVMAHSIGDVPVHRSSFMAAIFSPKRRVALEMLDSFVEDFKARAPIWKYDVIEGRRLYAADRSTPLPHSGILGV
ncbi:MAG: molybdenum cofactor biosynthesis protein MoaE [Campylobacteraceae bacterium 4484_4]|nr:MAG: molybdenum cofactor biosynthesis protein MoaE [Campylobacteraceae bacterium 4484_4]